MWIKDMLGRWVNMTQVESVRIEILSGAPQVLAYSNEGKRAYVIFDGVGAFEWCDRLMAKLPVIHMEEEE